METEQRGGLYAVMPPRLVFDPTISHLAKVVYAALACYANETRECHPRLAPIAKRLELSRSRISQALAELVAANYVEVDRRQDEGQPRATNHYFLVGPQSPRQAKVSQEQQSEQAKVSPTNPSKVSPTNVSPANLMNNIREREQYQDRTPISSAAAPQVGDVKKTPPHAPEARPPNPYVLMQQHQLWRAFATFLPAPETIIEQGRWAKAVQALDMAGATPEELRARVIRFKAKWPRASITPTGMASTWSQLSSTGGSDSGEDLGYRRLVEQRAANAAEKQRQREAQARAARDAWLADLDRESAADAQRLPR